MTGMFFTDAPSQEEGYRVGEKVEVYCDHTLEGDRIRDWLEGTVVQVDQKMVAVQFQTDVYLTDGWMVPDRVLWFPTESSSIRKPSKRKRKPRSQSR